MPIPQVFLQQQIVGGCDIVLLVRLNAAGRVLQVEVKLGQLPEDLLVDGHAVISDYNSAVEGDVRDLFAPRVSVDLLKGVAFGWVYVQDLLE